MKTYNNKFSAVIIGGSTLPIRCGEILLNAGHEVYAVSSTDAEVAKWADGHGVSLFSSANDLAAKVDKPFDYLFSIVNQQILKEEILRLPRKLAINYHDAFLPRYAGTHATSWALINQETVHGISWHIITDLVDGGDILRQREVSISGDDTAFTLNTKCYEAATEAFSDLVDDLSTGKLLRLTQDLKKRTFFPRLQRPPDGGVISWASSSAEIYSLVRALNFGPHLNALGVAKVAFGDNLLIVEEVGVSEIRSQSLAGTINEIGLDFLRVSTNDKDILLRRLRRLTGRSVTIDELRVEFELRVGDLLPNLDSDALQRLEKEIDSVSRHEGYWARKLLALEPVVAPYARRSSPSVSKDFSESSFQVPAEFEAFFAKSRTSHSLSEYIIAAFGSFLSRLTDRDYYDVGYRDLRVLNGFIGLGELFASEVPFRFVVDGSADFEGLVATTAREIDSVTRNKLFANDLFARHPKLTCPFESGEFFALPIAIVIVEDINDYKPQLRNELVLAISPNESRYRLMYDKNSFEEENFEVFCSYFATHLKNIGTDPNCPLARLPLLSTEEWARIVVDWNMNETEVPPRGCILDLFHAQVDKTPDATALVAGGKRLTYQDLNERSNELAVRLQRLGVGPEILVAICIERSVELIVGILGILKAGGAYVPMDPAYPSPRLNYILDDSRASVLLTQRKLARQLGQHTANVVYVDDNDAARSESGTEMAPATLAKPDNLAYVIYTSGSTGNPKGVAIEHRNAAALLSWATSLFGFERLRGTLASTSICFDLSIFEIFAPLSCGGTVILVENVLHLPSDPAAQEVTLVNTVPSAMTELLRINGIPDSVATVNLAGEPLRTSLVQQIYQTGTVREVYDLYGPTEDTTYSTFTLRNEGIATIGRPIPNTETYVLDRNLQPLPVGVPGELFLGGEGLARGYLNRPELTQERFISNPFNTGTSARLYRTGDLVRYLPTGELEYLGRIDNQVKVRGYRIELGEVEAAISTHPNMAETVVVADDDRVGQKRLVAYFVRDKREANGIDDLREYLKSTLPDHMIPSMFIELDELPLTANGKIDRKSLPAPEAATPRSRSGLVVHRDDLELKLTEIWEEILGIRPIGINDNFFELGGHSLKAIRMFAQVEESFGKNIPLGTLFEAGTIEKLASILRTDGWAAPESSLVPIQPVGSKPPFFCIHAKGGNVLFYRDLARYLGNDQPFYGLQARRLAGRQIAHPTVEEMAEFYIKEIRDMVPDGPFYLGGASFGGLVAFEMAQQLQRQGKRVAFLALFDTGALGYPVALPNVTALQMTLYRLARRIQHHRDTLRAFGAKERTNYILERLKKAKLKYRRKVRDKYKSSVRRFYSITKGTSSIPASYIQIEDLIWKAGQRYVPQVYRGKITLFRASFQPLGIYPDPALGWSSLVEGELEIHEVPGHHGSIVAEPYVANLAEQLSDCLRSAHLKKDSFEEEKKQRPVTGRKLAQAQAGSVFINQ